MTRETIALTYRFCARCGISQEISQNHLSPGRGFRVVERQWKKNEAPSAKTLGILESTGAPAWDKNQMLGCVTPKGDKANG